MSQCCLKYVCEVTWISLSEVLLAIVDIMGTMRCERVAKATWNPHKDVLVGRDGGSFSVTHLRIENGGPLGPDQPGPIIGGK